MQDIHKIKYKLYHHPTYFHPRQIFKERFSLSNEMKWGDSSGAWHGIQGISFCSRGLFSVVNASEMNLSLFLGLLRTNPPPPPGHIQTRSIVFPPISSHIFEIQQVQVSHWAWFVERAWIPLLQPLHCWSAFLRRIASWCEELWFLRVRDCSSGRSSWCKWNASVCGGK